MRILKSKLRQIIKEELLKEANTRRFVQRPKGATQRLSRAPLPTRIEPADTLARYIGSQDDPDYGRQEEPDLEKAERHAEWVVKQIMGSSKDDHGGDKEGSSKDDHGGDKEGFSEDEHRGVWGGDREGFLNFQIFALKQKMKPTKDALEKGGLSAKDHEDRAFNIIIQNAISKLEKLKQNL